MNIHFKDKTVFEELKRITLFSIKMGSYMYGTNDEHSDTDILHIYMPSEDEINSMASSHHQYQYKDVDTDTDHIFTDIFTFLKNSLSGDATINFEVINHESMKDSKLGFIYDMRYAFHNYKIMRSYLGLARRDLKHITKGKTDRDKNKKLNHVERGFSFCLDIMGGIFDTKIDKDSDLYKKLLTNKEIVDSRLRHEKGNELKNQISSTRDCLNKWLDDGNLRFPQYMKAEDMKKLDLDLKFKMRQWRKELGTSNYFEKLEDVIYDSIANGIKYEDGKQYIVT